MFDGSVIMLVPIVNAKFSPAVSESDAKFDMVTTCPEIEHVDDENPLGADSVHVPVVIVNSDGNVTTMLALLPALRAVAACRLRLKLTESSTVVLVALMVGAAPSARAPAVAVTVIPLLLDEYMLLAESYRATVKLPEVATLGGLIRLVTNTKNDWSLDL